VPSRTLRGVTGASRQARAGHYRRGGYERARRELLEGEPPCVHCGRATATEADHAPPLALHEHVAGSGCCMLVPSCGPCARAQGGALGAALGGHVVSQASSVDVVEPEPVAFERFDVPWLADLLHVPADATWPRLMTCPHPRAVGSYGPEVEAFVFIKRGRQPHWWQRLLFRRLLEHDADGALVWDLALLTLARQLGKTWAMAALCGWRLEAWQLFKGEQTILSTGKDIEVVVRMQRPFRALAKREPEQFHVREVNGQQEIEELWSGSQWLVRSQQGVYGVTATFATVDEAWKVPASVVDDGIEPTTVESPDSQILLASTAHRRATALMVGRRVSAFAELHTGDGALLVEWSAPPDADLHDRAAWRLASPHWSPKREQLMTRRLDRALAGESSDVDEPDPIASFRTQWLNQWPGKRLKLSKGDPLIDVEQWDALAGDVADDPERIFVAVEDHAGMGAAIAAVCVQPDGRLGLDGWIVPTWAQALDDLRRLQDGHEGFRLTVGASLLVRLPPGIRGSAGTSTLSRSTLPLLRELVADRALVHDSAEVAEQVASVRVTEAVGGLAVVAGARSDLVRAASWALAAAHRPRKTPSIR